MTHSTTSKKDLCDKEVNLGRRNVACTLYQRGGILLVRGNVRYLHATKILQVLEEKGADINPSDWFIKNRTPESITFWKN
ncbi:hypothetical protein KKC45_01305 [Patescibacteria group bacterium]|nr:hypothetical protein [Patescibacteria group bacterium]